MSGIESESAFFDDRERDDVEGVLSRSDREISALVSVDVVLVSPSASLRDAATRLNLSDVGLVAVGDLGDIEGVISERDIVRAVALGSDLDQTSVASVESQDLVWATETSTVADVAAEMMERYVRHVLIRDSLGQLVGVISMRDILTAYMA